jgi:phthalate 4,5-cis-dihydrodiol dehydrogenase
MVDAKVRLGVIGTGSARRMYGPSLVHLGHPVVAAADPDPVAREEAKKDFSITEVFASVDEMLDATPLDGVIVSSPPFCHLEHVETAARRGRKRRPSWIAAGTRRFC